MPDLEDCLQADLETVVQLFPPVACSKLQLSTPVYVNKSISYGKQHSPVNGRTCTFHPLGGAHWLHCNGLSVAKEGSVEIQSAEDYLQSRQHWGIGGIFVHELSHAFHNKFCAGGYGNEPINEAYDTAMARKLYDCVRVHGPQGISGQPQKAYACTNSMEFFAELSVAYHWASSDSEYNKWYPFNRQQLIEHDPASFDTIHRLWTQYEALASTRIVGSAEDDR
jgi:dipeptidyl-peptidase 4